MHLFQKTQLFQKTFLQTTPTMAEEEDASSEDELMEWATACTLLKEEIDADEQFKLAVEDYLSSSNNDVKYLAGGRVRPQHIIGERCSGLSRGHERARASSLF